MPNSITRLDLLTYDIDIDTDSQASMILVSMNFRGEGLGSEHTFGRG
jgi:hypothetical protein